MRVVSLLPAGTEIVCALGARDVLVGVSHECDFPSDVAGLPALTRSRLSVGDTSESIHRSMTELIEAALAIYEVDVDRLRALEPDIIVTQDLCEVCAVSYQDVGAAVREMTNRHVEIVRLHPARLDDVYADVRRIGDAVGRRVQADRLVDGLRRRMARLDAISGTLPVRSLLLLEWLQPVMAGGLWSADLATAAGARAVASRPGAHARTLGPAELSALEPDVVAIKPCGFALSQSLAEVHRFPEYFPWTTWPAARSGRVFVADGNAYFNRPGPRLVDSAEILAGCVHEEDFAYLRRAYTDAVRRVNPDLTLAEFDD